MNLYRNTDPNRCDRDLGFLRMTGPKQTDVEIRNILGREEARGTRCINRGSGSGGACFVWFVWSLTASFILLCFLGYSF